MKKIIAAFDGLKYSESTKAYALAITKLSDAHLVGAFLDDPTYTSYKIYELIVKDGVSEARLKKFMAKDTLKRNAAATAFKSSCEKEGLEFTIHHDCNIAIQELKHESIYADLMIIDAAETLTHYEEELPTRFIKDLLEGVHCPVLVVPSKYRPVEKIKFLYDGQPSSVHAIKMFSYVMECFKDLPIELVSVKKVGYSFHIPDNKLMKEFMKRHFPYAHYKVRQSYFREDEIINMLKKETGNTLIVLGAYSRGMVSRWLNPSLADMLLKNIKAPLFIAHNK